MTLIQDKYPKHVCITGGEPLLQPSGEMNLLLTLLDYADYTVDIFTNGTIDLSPIIQLPFTIVMDWKLQGSGEGNTLLEQRKSNRKLLRTYDVVKFVVADEADLEEMLALITEWETAHQKVSLGTDRWLTWHQLAVTPAWGRMEPHLVVEFLEAHQLKDVRLSLQVHKYVWHPKQRRI
jgi:7-carboxy-7-deazaguanine synthase